MDYIAVAEAGYAKAHVAQGLTPHNFRGVPFIAFNRKDDGQTEFVGKAFGLKRVTLNQLFVPSSEGQVRAVLAGWGVSILPELLVRGLLEQGHPGGYCARAQAAHPAVLALLEPGIRCAGCAQRCPHRRGQHGIDEPLSRVGSKRKSRMQGVSSAQHAPNAGCHVNKGEHGC
jgi:DNA-binding transcriptional LysR family regulator